MNIAARTVRSTVYNVTSTAIYTAVMLVRGILLARLLDPEHFGVFTLQLSIVTTTQVIAQFGLSHGLVHRVAQDRADDTAIAIHFTLSNILTLAWVAVLLLGSYPLQRLAGWPNLTRQTFQALTLVYTMDLLASTPTAVLTREVAFQQMALLRVIGAVFSSVVAVLMAWRGYGVWSLVASEALMQGVQSLGLWVRPPWRPRLLLSWALVKWYLSFGSKATLSQLLTKLADHLDDMWTGFVMGDTPLGFYSRAYRFAFYPRQLVALPINAVAFGTYAQVQDDRTRLSQAFFRINALVVRAGFLFALVLNLTAPEFIPLVIGPKWLPMLTAFRLMLIYTLLDPLTVTSGYLLTAVGRPQTLAWIRAAQVGSLAAGLVTLGPRFGIEGVAVAANLMLLVGVALLLWQVRHHVDFSLPRLLSMPLLALLLAGTVTMGLERLWWQGINPWLRFGAKVVASATVYAAVLLILERRQFLQLVDMLRPALKDLSAFLRSKRRTSTPSRRERGYFRSPRARIVALVPATARRILDAGCGEGIVGAMLKAQASGRYVVGVELDPEAAQCARTRLDRVYQGDVQEMELDEPPASFDCLIYGDVLEHLVEPLKALQQHRPLLRQGGHIVVSVPNVQFYYVLWSILRGRWTYTDRGIFDRSHLRFFTRREVQRLLSDAGYRIVSIERNYRLLERPSGINRAAACIAWFPPLRPFLTYQYLLLAQKTEGDGFR